ncbi:MAG TPA: alkaline phosphatase family protein [Bacteroides sp.]|nr:alkaline phosphatase family protein [Bacteroides sp.]
MTKLTGTRLCGFLILGIILLAGGSCRKKEVSAHDNYVVMVSFDGFRWDYADLYDTPTFDAMARNGVRAIRMIPSFPTQTFPNHYTLATGLYPDHHGIINNSFYAPELGGVYRISDRRKVQDPDAYFGEPIWVTAEKQGIRTASYFWVGSEAPVRGTHPTYWKTYDGSIPYMERVDTVIRWLKLPMDKRPRLILLYFDEPDHSGHDYGPVHPEMGKVVEYLDEVLAYLRGEIADLEYGDRVNLVVLSDHGMASVSPQRYVNLYDHIKPRWVEHITGGSPVSLVDAAAGCEDSITVSLNKVEGVMAWKKNEIPARLHYGSSPRFPDVLLMADSGWSIGTGGDPSVYTGGTHGYDNAFTQMHTIFYAEGPDFRKGYVQPDFPNVEVYGIVARLLELKPARTDGDPARVSGMFSTPD